jgi:hypothetical protein
MAHPEQTPQPPLKPRFEDEYPDSEIQLDLGEENRHNGSGATMAMLRGSLGRSVVSHEIPSPPTESGTEQQTAVKPGASPYVDQNGRSRRKPAPQSKRSRPSSVTERRLADKKPLTLFDNED